HSVPSRYLPPFPTRRSSDLMTLHPPYKVGRIIARPFDGELGAFERRNNHRHDYALSPFDRTAMNELEDDGYDVIALGKINDIYKDRKSTRLNSSHVSISYAV